MLENLQIELVPFIAWLFLREKPPSRALLAIPVVLVGVVLISGAFEQGAYGRNRYDSANRSTGSSPRSPTRASCSSCVRATAPCGGRPVPVDATLAAVLR